MNKIKCDFCKKENKFEDEKIRACGKAKIIFCEYCSRSINIEFKEKKYYKKILETS